MLERISHLKDEFLEKAEFYYELAKDVYAEAVRLYEKKSSEADNFSLSSADIGEDESETTSGGAPFTGPAGKLDPIEMARQASLKAHSARVLGGAERFARNNDANMQHRNYSNHQGN